jgi:hypothetical protein
MRRARAHQQRSEEGRQRRQGQDRGQRRHDGDAEQRRAAIDLRHREILVAPKADLVLQLEQVRERRAEAESCEHEAQE